jgi:HJR/Mrr/RecB family endonuclease
MLKSHEVRALEGLAAECAGFSDEEDRQLAMLEFFFPRRLHWLLESGFDEVRIARVPITPSAEERQRLDRDPKHKVLKFGRAGAIRQIHSGAWYYVAFGSEPSFARNPEDVEPKIALIPVEMPKRLSDMIFLPLSQLIATARVPTPPSALIMPALWCPPEQCRRIELVDTTMAILEALQRQAISLRDVTWRQLEEIVAELLGARGLDVHLTKATRDGGRDILARGELILGEPTTIAVEVKHRGTVGTPDIHRAWAANQDLPLVMVVTSGRFSAGVVNEKRRNDKYHRLLLKDGAGLSQWIAQYRRR